MSPLTQSGFTSFDIAMLVEFVFMHPFQREEAVSIPEQATSSVLETTSIPAVPSSRPEEATSNTTKHHGQQTIVPCP